MRRSRALALVLILAACSGDPATAPSPSAPPATASATSSPSPSPSPSPTASPTPTADPSCPATYVKPYADQPVVLLQVRIADDHRTVTGRETVTFTPDLPVSEVVFRLWANAPRPRSGGGRITVTSATIDGAPVTGRLSSGDTLLRLPLARRAPAGVALRIDLAFTLRLPVGVNERMGSSGGTAWFASAQPLLAWERGRGWATEPATSAFAEATTSEAFRLEKLIVGAPKGDTVLATGVHVIGGTYRAASVRDVMIAAGRFRTATGRAGDVPITVGVAPGLPDDPQRLVGLHAAAIAAHAKRFGPFPYEDLDVAVVPQVSGGIEYPGAILLGSRQDDDPTLSHEVAHEWFYGLVGNNQGRDPWLDEALATYAEALHRGTAGAYLSREIPAAGRNRVGRPMTFWESRRDAYFRSVYVQGAAALLRARAAVGAAAFDAAIRCYVAANAHRVATPADLAEALAAYPAALAELRRAGALS